MEVVPRKKKIGPVGWQLLRIIVNPYGGVVWHKGHDTVSISTIMSSLLLSSTIREASIRPKDIRLTVHIPVKATRFPFSNG